MIDDDVTLESCETLMGDGNGWKFVPISRRHWSSGPEGFQDGFITGIFEDKANHVVMLPSGQNCNNPEDYIYEDFETTDLPLPGVTIGRVTARPDNVSVNIGEQILDKHDLDANRLRESQKNITFEDPFGEEGKNVKARVTSKNLAKGETVYTLLDTLSKQ